MSQKQVRKRGANYTQEEKILLLDLIMQYKDIVESKRTGGIIIQKKKEVWITITSKYNSSCSSGPRDVDQLKALYDNMKQKSRKEISEKNKEAYIQAMEMEVVTEADVTRALINIKEDKIEMKKTGGGFWKPKSTETDAKVLSIIKEQTEPLHNPYDSAADFFNDVVEITCTDEGNKLIDNDLINSSPYTPCVALKEISMTTGLEEVTPKRVASESEGKVVKKREFSMGSGSIKKINEPAHIKMLQKKKVTPRKLIKKSSAEQLKNTYFKKKSQNADLERKKLMIEILYIKKEHELRMQILKAKQWRLEKH
ncbi:uncharacterized protein LOC119628387 isoform X1 [Bombyx mori]|uniref:Regulatory protein zeste n=2 Tax=Bombyx mori TaxID=7091 RepID=A0A8R2MBG0_BOMMO|nr:uncharacterized protein LOC119628387 isoform X1 [Bombyx mori]